jgi:hypothetical protein
MRKIIRISAFLALFAAAPAYAGGTADQQAACETDARSYCESAIPDENAIEKCLRANINKISSSCRDQLGGGKGSKSGKGKRR